VFLLLGFYNYTVWLTFIGLLSSVCGIFFAFQGNAQAAVMCLLFSGLCDMFDGKVARTKKDRTDEEKRFGIQLDSLSDIVCFGVLPASISFAIGATKIWQLVIAALFVLCGLIRLAYFNVTEETRQKSTSENRKMYSGLPITSSAILVPLLICFAKPLERALPFAFTALLVVMGICFITPLNVKKPGLWGGIIMLIAGAAIFVIIILLK
jgi:Phosphatidylserine synthase